MAEQIIQANEVAAKGRANPFTRLMAFLGPGLFLIGYNIGTGSVTTMASAGSRWGMSLTWTVVLSCVFTYIGLLAFSRYTLVTGDTILYAIRRRLPWGSAIGMFLLVAVTLAEFAGITGLMAICVDLILEWIRFATGQYNGAIKLTVTLALTAMLFWVLWRGSYTFLENLLGLLVAVMGVSFLITAALLVPSWRAILSGLVPRVPQEPDAALLVAGMAGTTFSSAILYCRSITLKHKRWSVADSKHALVDTIVSVTVMFALSIAVMICAAGTLFVAGRPIEAAVDMIKTLEPLAGKFAITLFVVGVLGAGISSLIPTILIGPWLIGDYTNRPIDPKSTSSRILVTVGALIALGAPYFPPSIAKPVFLMILTMALLAVILPFSTIAIMVLLNQKTYMKEHRSGPVMNLACHSPIVFSLIMTYYAVSGLCEYVQLILPA
ncbi:MAG: Nramp family divalent metal transporter [Candidatus Hydrogenedentes bacterium]|nr:Nramp family divalent metal transporter [Candidatus Hydrogenedentota bacterium]